MVKKQQNISINILAVLILLLSLLLLSVGVGNAWFTSSQDRGIKISVRVDEYNVKLYQLDIQENSTLIYTYSKNNKNETDNYINLNSDILAPEQFINLKLKLVNEDSGAGVHLRYSLKLYACGVDEDTLIPINITLGSDFLQNEDYFYYVDNQDEHKTFAKPNETILCTGFKIPYSSFQLFNGGETIRIELVIECVDPNVGF